MGTYAAATDIQSEFRKIDFSASGALVSTAEVNEFIDQVEAYVEGRVSCKYAVPITATAAIPIIKMIVTYLVKDRVSKIIKVKTNNNSAQDEEQNLTEMAEEMLDNICSGDLKLVGQATLETDEGISSWAAQNTSTFTRKFKRGIDQW